MVHDTGATEHTPQVTQLQLAGTVAACLWQCGRVKQQCHYRAFLASLLSTRGGRRLGRNRVALVIKVDVGRAAALAGAGGLC